MDGGSTKINGHCVKMDNRFVKMNDPSKKRGGLNFLCPGIKRFRAAKASKMLVEYEKGPFHFLNFPENYGIMFVHTPSKLHPQLIT